MKISLRLERALRAAAVIGSTAGFSLGLATVACAQIATARTTATDSRWMPWLGCWESVSTGTASANADGGVTCNVPVSGSAAIQSLSIVGGKIVSRHRLDASGKSYAIDEGGCKGSESASWAPSGRRVYLHAGYTCAGGLAGSSTSIVALTPSGDWLEVQSVRAGGGTVNRIFRWRDAGLPSDLPKEVTAALTGKTLAITTARAAASRALRPDDVIDAVQSVDSSAVRLWLGETGQRFALDGTQLQTLERADVPSSVLRAMMGDFGDEVSPAQQGGGGDYGVDGYARTNAFSDGAYGDVMQNPYSAYNGSVLYPDYSAYPYAYPYYGYGGVPVVVYPTVPFIETRGQRRGLGDNRAHVFAGHPSTGRPPAPTPPGAHVGPSHVPVTRAPATHASGAGRGRH